MKRILYFGLSVILLVILISIFGNYYSVIFATSVSGRIIGVQKVTEATTVIGTGSPIPSAQLFSFSVAIRSEKGEIYTGSTEDRQWAVAREGMCVRARFFPYPFWDLQKSGTYFNVRMVQMFDCPQGYADAPENLPTPAVPTQVVATPTVTAEPTATPELTPSPTPIVEAPTPTPIPTKAPKKVVKKK